MDWTAVIAMRTAKLAKSTAIQKSAHSGKSTVKASYQVGEAIPNSNPLEPKRERA